MRANYTKLRKNLHGEKRLKNSKFAGIQADGQQICSNSCRNFLCLSLEIIIIWMFLYNYYLFYSLESHIKLYATVSTYSFYCHLRKGKSFSCCAHYTALSRACKGDLISKHKSIFQNWTTPSLFQHLSDNYKCSCNHYKLSIIIMWIYKAQQIHKSAQGALQK